MSKGARLGVAPAAASSRPRGSLGFSAFIVVWQPLFAYDALGRALPRIVWRVETSRPLVALTFDDGPAPDHTPKVLEILARHGAHATFFLIGNRAVSHPETVEQIRAGGHEVGNHYYTLRSTLRASDQEFRDDLKRTGDALHLEGPLKLFRPPGGRIRSRQLDEAIRQGYTCVLGSAYPFDGARPPAAYIRWVVSKNLAPGTIVILHDGIADPSRSIAALPGILEAGRRQGPALRDRLGPDDGAAVTAAPPTVLLTDPQEERSLPPPSRSLPPRRCRSETPIGPHPWLTPTTTPTTRASPPWKRPWPRSGRRARPPSAPWPAARAACATSPGASRTPSCGSRG